MTPEQLAQLFHETYERLAPDFGYETRKESAVPWSEVPRENRQLMIAVAKVILEHINPETVVPLSELRELFSFLGATQPGNLPLTVRVRAWIDLEH